jgi:hypothetical protein
MGRSTEQTGGVPFHIWREFSKHHFLNIRKGIHMNFSTRLRYNAAMLAVVAGAILKE